MKTLHKKVLQKWGVIALTITALGLPTVAKTADDLLPKEGVSLDELNRIVPDLEVLREGRRIELEGSIPARCADKAGVSYEHKDGKHLVTVRLADACENDFKEVRGEKKVALSSILSAINLKDASGPVKLKYLKAGPPRSRERVQDKESLLDARGKEMLIVSSADIKAADDAKAIDDLAKKIDALCKKRDYEKVSNALEAAKNLLGDVSDLLGGVTALEQENFKLLLAEANTGAKAKAVREQYLEVAPSKNWDETALDKDYIARRFAIIAKLVEESKGDQEISAAKVDAELVAWRRELSGMDRDTYKAAVNKFAVAYGDLGMNEYAAGKAGKNLARLEMSEKMYIKGMELSANKTKWQEVLAKVNNQAFKVCVDKNPENMAKCESKFADKGKEYADQVKETLSAQAEGSEDGALAYAQFMQDYGSTYGEGPSYFYAGYGRSNPQAPGAIEQYKQNALQNYYQSMQQKMMQGQGGQMGARGKSNLF